MTDRQEMEAVVEAILFVANEPVSRDKLLEVFAENEREAAAEALEAVVERYRESPVRGVVIDEVAGGLRLVSRPDLHGYLRRFFEVTGTNKLTMPALESLSIIAYRQPVTAPEIQELRGVSSSGVLKKLLERRLIRIAGRKEVVGKPFLYATTREFLQHFGLRSLKELPPLEHFEELFGGDVVADSENAEPDPEEELLREEAEVADRDDEAAERAEVEAIDAERAAAEEAEEMTEDSPAADAEVEAESPQPEAAPEEPAEAVSSSSGEGPADEPEAGEPQPEIEPEPEAEVPEPDPDPTAGRLAEVEA